MSEPFAISIAQDGDAVTLTLTGELDLSGVDAFDATLQAIGPHVRSVVIDLAGLTFVDSSGIGCFLRARAAALETGSSLLLRSPSPQVRKVLDVIDLGQSIEIVD